ncbi:MAG: hypothetical protein EAZ42_08865 [Verrucomicrobia bacterium]|nr:MAG: hypothetical protein EAZ42_08865 [Verrucomicrobiota bacterium]
MLEQEHVTQTKLASRMKASRDSLDRMLDPPNPSLTVASLGKAAAALGRKVELISRILSSQQSEEKVKFFFQRIRLDFFLSAMISRSRLMRADSMTSGSSAGWQMPARLPRPASAHGRTKWKLRSRKDRATGGFRCGLDTS